MYSRLSYGTYVTKSYQQLTGKGHGVGRGFGYGSRTHNRLHQRRDVDNHNGDEISKFSLFKAIEFEIKDSHE